MARLDLSIFDSLVNRVKAEPLKLDLDRHFVASEIRSDYTIVGEVVVDDIPYQFHFLGGFTDGEWKTLITKKEKTSKDVEVSKVVLKKSFVIRPNSIKEADSEIVKVKNQYIEELKSLLRQYRFPEVVNRGKMTINFGGDVELYLRFISTNTNAGFYALIKHKNELISEFLTGMVYAYTNINWKETFHLNFRMLWSAYETLMDAVKGKLLAIQSGELR